MRSVCLSPTIVSLHAPFTRSTAQKHCVADGSPRTEEPKGADACLSPSPPAAGGTASFTSIRRGKNGRFEVLRWKITRDDGAVLDLMGLDLTKPLEGLE